MPNHPQAADDRIIIHLIPGTWYDGVWTAIRRRISPARAYASLQGQERWFQDDHEFRKTLDAALAKQGLVADYRTFLWSGFNSFRARADAAEELVLRIAKGATETAPQIIIAHSHGGTVAMQALQLAAEGSATGFIVHDGQQIWMPGSRKSQKELVIDLADAVKLNTEQLRQAIKGIDLITLATPFMRVEPYSGGQNVARSIQFCCFMLYLIAWILVSRRWGYNAGSAVALGFGVGISLAYRFVHQSRTRIRELVINKQATTFPGRRILCIRSNADEASLGISLGIIACNVNRLLLTICGNILGSIPVFLTLVAFAAAIALMTLLITAPPDTSLRWLYFVAFVLAFPVLWVTVASLSQAALGIDLIWNGLELLTTVESCPDASPGQISIQTLSAEHPVGAGLRHSIYEHSGSVPAIISAIVSGS